jgi:hypothetical protein
MREVRERSHACLRLSQFPSSQMARVDHEFRRWGWRWNRALARLSRSFIRSENQRASERWRSSPSDNRGSLMVRSSFVVRRTHNPQMCGFTEMDTIDRRASACGLREGADRETRAHGHYHRKTDVKKHAGKLTSNREMLPTFRSFQRREPGRKNHKSVWYPSASFHIT